MESEGARSFFVHCIWGTMRKLNPPHASRLLILKVTTSKYNVGSAHFYQCPLQRPKGTKLASFPGDVSYLCLANHRTKWSPAKLWCPHFGLNFVLAAVKRHKHTHMHGDIHTGTHTFNSMCTHPMASVHMFTHKGTYPPNTSFSAS